MMLNLREVLRSIGDLAKKSWDSLDVNTQKIVLGVLVFLFGAFIPWGRFGDVGGYIQVGLIAAGILTAYMGSKKSGDGSLLGKLGLDGLFDKKGEKKGDKDYCPECGKEI